ncbi:MAG: hypothetical protein HYZ75_16705 [Elusimicrobia bacterium]|nr:hypothetical protein [Elusimicrobiota bacterium]
MKVVALLVVCALLPLRAFATPDRPSAGPAIEVTGPAIGQARGSEAAVLDADAAPDEGSSELARRGFGERSGAAPVGLGGRVGMPMASAPARTTQPQRFAASANPPPGVYAAEEKGKEEDKGGGWDYDGTMKAAGLALAGAAIGFLLGGPIGAAAGFLAGFFVGALLWKAGQK